jgi:tetratricopeptide (TPR) repeat protein
MGFDKAKVMRAAEKSLAQGKIPAAIKEYQLIVKHDPDDFSALNMLGDLLIRTNDQPEAIKCFSRVAEHYREEGFALKAIAMFKKIDRLNPGSIEIAAKLAPLYEVQGLIVDARTHYLMVADAYSKGGHAAKALDVLRKIADLDPNNTDIRLKLAQGYQRENFRSEAAEAYSHAGAQFFARAAYELALDAYTNALSSVPHDPVALSGITSTHIARGTPEEAAEMLENAATNQPDEVEILSLLAHAYVEAEDAPAAERATALLVQKEPSSFKRFGEVARVYLKAGDVPAAVRVLNGIAEHMLSGNEERTLADLLDEVLTHDPEQMNALRLLVRLHTWQHDNEKLRGALERFTEAAQAAGLEDEERQALANLVRLAPEEPRFLDRLKELGGSLDNAESRSAFSSGDTGDIPTFESFIPITEDEAASPVEEPAQFEWNAVTPPSADPAASFADLNDSWAGAQASEESAPATGFQEFEFHQAGGPPAASSESDTSIDISQAGPERKEALLKHELEGVDFYLAQGYSDIARDTLDMLERQFGAHAEIESRRQQLSGSVIEAMGDEAPSAVESPVASASFAAEPVPAVATPTAAPVAPAKPKIDPGLAAIFDEFRSAVEDEEVQETDGDYETHYNLGLAYKDMDLMDEAAEEFQIAASLVAPRDGTPRYLQCCNLLGHCFGQKNMARQAVMWYKRGLDAPGHTEDEYQALRYELGAAYERMGELDKAIDVFSEVYGVDVSYRGVADKLRDLQSQKAMR